MRLQMAVLEAIAQFERERIAERVRAGQRRRRLQLDEAILAAPAMTAPRVPVPFAAETFGRGGALRRHAGGVIRRPENGIRRPSASRTGILPRFSARRTRSGTRAGQTLVAETSFWPSQSAPLYPSRLATWNCPMTLCASY
ncbi:MAG: hypothetical protein ACRD3C_00475 [Vicinamibacterales bacterium]